MFRGHIPTLADLTPTADEWQARHGTRPYPVTVAPHYIARARRIFAQDYSLESADAIAAQVQFDELREEVAAVLGMAGKGTVLFSEADDQFLAAPFHEDWHDSDPFGAMEEDPPIA